jgi:hypothetical protein
MRVLGLMGTAAYNAVTANPITPLSQDNVTALFAAAYGNAYNVALLQFNGVMTQGNGNFLTLPSAVQSVLTDLVYNFGSLSGLPDSLAQAIASQNWATLANLLVSVIGGQRGKSDAAVLNNAIKKGTLASSGPCST